MIAKKTAEDARNVIVEWCEAEGIHPTKVAELLSVLREVPGNKSWRESVAGLTRLVDEASQEFD